jgi:hypothetical protein
MHISTMEKAGLRWPLACLFIFLLITASAAAQQRIVLSSENDPPVDKAAKTVIIDKVTEALNEIYVFPDKAKAMETLVRKNLEAGKYKSITSLALFTQQLTQDLRSVCHDRHLAVMPFVPPPAGEQGPSGDGGRDRADPRYQNYGFRKLEILPGNIGYLDLRMFADAGAAGDTAVAAMNFLAHCDAVIFDLRRNGGGSPSMIQLITSYFFEEPVHLNSFYVRKTDEMQQFWTQSRVEGPRMIDTPIYVLTSSFTFSGAEEFTYNLKNLERAVIIGETTGGGAHPVDFHRFPEAKVAMALPFGRAINPITGTNWEGTGIDPHIAVPADQALDVAQMEALKKLLESNQNKGRKAQIQWALAGFEAKCNPIKLEDSDLDAFVGKYGPRTIRLKEGVLHYQREGRNAFALVPMGRDLFMLKELDSFRIQFERDESGEVTRIVGLYDNGQQDANERTKS